MRLVLCVSRMLLTVLRQQCSRILLSDNKTQRNTVKRHYICSALPRLFYGLIPYFVVDPSCRISIPLIFFNRHTHPWCACLLRCTCCLRRTCWSGRSAPTSEDSSCFSVRRMDFRGIRPQASIPRVGMPDANFTGANCGVGLAF